MRRTSSRSRSASTPRPPAASTLTTSTPTLTGASDASFTFDLQYQNDTAQDLTVSVSATGPEGWDVTATLTGETQAASTVVEAGASQGITVTAKAPTTSPRAHIPSRSRPAPATGPSSADLGIEVTGSFSMTLSTPNDVLSGERVGGLAHDPGLRDRQHGHRPA